MKIAVTGHRPQRLSDPPCWDPDHPLRVAIRKALRHQLLVMFGNPDGDMPLILSGGGIGIAGMAQGVDQDFARVALDLGMRVEAYLPCVDQDLGWPTPAKLRYMGLLTEIANSGGEVKYVSPKPYTPKCTQRRNEAMVDDADHLIAVWDRVATGGTYRCITYAQNQWMTDAYALSDRITVIDPRTLLAGA